MATGGDSTTQNGEMDVDGDLTPLEQSSGVIQFRLPVMRDDTRTPEEMRRARIELTETTRQRHSTPQNINSVDRSLVREERRDDIGRRGEELRPPQVEDEYRDDGRTNGGNDGVRPLQDGYYGDVRPRRYRGQGGGDQPGIPRPRETARVTDHVRPQFNRGYNYMAGDFEEDRFGEIEGRAANRSNRPLVKPERYDGTEDWSTYIQHFEWCADLNRWTELDKARFLTVSVTGTARQVLAGVSRDRLRDYGTVVQILRARFDPIGRLELHRIQLKNRVRQSGESLPTLADDVRRLVDRVFQDIPSEARDKLARDSFIDALTDGEMRTRIPQMRTTTIQEAMEAAIELEALSKAERERGQRKIRELGGGPVQSEATLLQELRDELMKIKRQLGEQRPRNNDTRKCFNCGDPSHFIRDCPKPKKTFGRGGPQGGN